MKMTICEICGNEFKTTDGRRKYCSKSCVKIGLRKWRREYMRNYWKLNPQQYVKNQARLQKTRADLRFQVLTHYGGNPPKCACCGEDHIEFLEIDHIYGGGRKHRRKVRKKCGNFYRWIIKNGFPEGFQVLCANCNRAKREYNKRFCPVHHPELYNLNENKIGKNVS